MNRNDPFGVQDFANARPHHFVANFKKIATIQLTSEEKQMIILGLQMRRNYIETGNISYSAADAVRIGKYAPDDVKINALSTDQMRLILETEKLVAKLYKL